MNDAQPADALYHPFHLCSPSTLTALLDRFAHVHFRDYMALQLTPFSGTTAYHDRMGAAYPELVGTGRLVQGHVVSGPITAELAAVIDRDLADTEWRYAFHRALVDDRRFQRGLFDPAHTMVIGGTQLPGPAVLLELMRDAYRHESYTVEEIRRRSAHARRLPEAYPFEYGLALLKTSAAQVHTQRLAARLDCVAVTDSPAHADLFARTSRREGWTIPHHLVSSPSGDPRRFR